MAITIEQLRQLSLGFTPVTPNVNGQQTVIVQSAPNDQSCLGDCDAPSCSVTPTEAVILDNGSFVRTNASKLRWAIDRTASIVAEIQHLTLMSNRGPENFNDYPSMFPDFMPAFGYFSNTPGVDIDPGAGVSLLISYAPDGSTINGDPGGPIVSQLNKVLSGGAILGGVTVRFDNTIAANAALSNMNITLGHLPVDTNNAVVVTTVYDPFCDFCTSNNAGDFTTHRYTFNGPTTFRDFVDIEIPNDSVFTLELCYGIINLPNTAAAPASKQWL